MATIEEQAIQELVQNIVQRADGKVWMDDWRGRFGSLGPTPKDFMEQRPDLFQLNYHGRGFSVELIGDGEAMAKDMGADSGTFSPGGPRKGGPKGGVVLAEPIGGGKGKTGGMKGPKGGIVLAAPKGAHDFGKGGGDSFGSKGGKKGNRGPNLALPAQTGELADTAIAEIKDQMARRGEPKVWIDDWRQRYGSLGPSPKQFMESRSDVFRLSYQGNRYSVLLVEETVGGLEQGCQAAQEEDLYWQGRGGVQESGAVEESTSVGEGQPDQQACIDEISRLVQQSPDGRIWIPDWFRRFAHLAKSPRAFMESRPDIFVLTFKGNTYSVSLVEQEAGLAQPPGLPVKRAAEPPLALTQAEKPRPWKSQRTSPSDPIPVALGHAGHNSNPRHWTGPSPMNAAASLAPSNKAVESSSALDYLGDKEEDALAEIFDQLSKPYSNGKVNFPDWARRFGHLAANPREFIEGHPDKFEVIAGYGGSYTVELC